MAELSRLDRYLSIRMAHDGHPLADGRVVYISNLLGLPSPWLWDGSPAGPDPLVLDDRRTSAVAPSPNSPWLVLSQDTEGTERHELVAVHATTRERRALTRDPKVIHRFGAFFPDGERFVLAANRLDGVNFELYVGHLDGRELVPLVVNGSAALTGSWSAAAVWPDGRAILVVESLSPSHQRVYRLDLDPGDAVAGRLTRISPDDPAAYRSLAIAGGRVIGTSNLGSEFFRLVALDGGDIPRVTVLVDGDADIEMAAASEAGPIAYAVNRDGWSELYVMDGPEGAGNATRIPTDRGVVSSLRLARDGETLVFSEASPTSPSEVYRLIRRASTVERLTRSYRAGLGADTFRVPELVAIESFDGLKVPAWLYLPEGKAPAPVVVMVHGGPESQTRPGFSALHQYWLSLGVAVLAPNVRGSTGYGRTYEHLDDVALREGAIRDLGAVAAWAARHPRIDSDRIVVYGGSYGGYMVMAGLTWFPDRFRAGVEIVGIVNLETFLEHTSPWRRALREAEYGSLARDREALRRLSPIHRIGDQKAPLFIGHGKNDPRVPYEEAEQVAAALEQRGIPHELFAMGDEGHGAVRWQNQRRLYRAIQSFLERHAGFPAEE